MSSLFSLRFRTRLLFLVAPLLLLSGAPLALSGEIKLAWDPNTESDLAGYKIYYATSPRTGTDPNVCGLCGYTTVVSAGNVTTYSLGSLSDGQTYYVSVTATNVSNNESGFSNEVSGAAASATQTYAYAITTNPSGLQIIVDGTTYNSPQSFNWASGSSHALSVPSPQTGGTGTQYVFGSWSDGGSQSRSITAPSSATTYTANFATQYSLTTVLNVAGAGTVSPSGTGWYNSGQTVSVSAAANAGYSFTSWSGDLPGMANPASVVMSGPKGVTANFSQNQYTVAVNVSPAGSGTVGVSPSKATYVYGDPVTLTATPNSGYSFGSWSGDASGTTSPVTLTINGDKTVTANFAAIPETISVPTASSGPASGVTGTGYSYSAGGAISNLGHGVEYQFDWKGDGTDLSGWGGATQTKTWTSAGSYSVKARARCATHTNVASGWSNGLSVTISQATVSVTVATNPAGLQVVVDGSSYNAPQTFSWTPGSTHTVSLSSPQTGGTGTQYVFGSWSDGGSQSRSITAPSSATTYTVNFTTQYSLTTGVSVAGAGVVSPSGTGWYTSGQTVSVSASANAGYSFTSWSGDLSGTANPASVVMNGPKGVTANFSQNQYTVAVNVSPAGSGTVGMSPSKATYVYGDPVTLTATPNSGYSFGGWSGDGSGTTSPVTLTINGDKTVTANFAAIPETISVPTAPSGPASGATGTGYSYSAGGATSNLGHGVEYQFDWRGDGMDLSGWGGATQTKTWTSAGSYWVKARARCTTHTNVASGWSNGLSVTISQATVSVTVATSPAGLQVAVDGSSYTAPQTFSWTPGSTHTVSLSSPQTGGTGTQYVFGSWSDGGSQSHSITAPSSATTYTANFATQYSLTTGPNVAGAGTVSPSGTGWYNSGETVSVSAAANAGYSFTSWSGDLPGMANPASVVMSGPKGVTANFSQNQYTVAVNVSPAGSGTVGVSPSKAAYIYGDQVTLTATPGTGYGFGSWSGDGSGTTSPVTLTMNGNKVVTANFVSSSSFEVTPMEGLTASGKQGGPYTLSAGTYTLRNRTGTPINWKVSRKPRWLSLSLPGGSLAAGGTIAIGVSINSNADYLDAGSYSEQIVLSNSSDPNDSISRPVVLTVSRQRRSYTFNTNPQGLQLVVDSVTYTSPQTFDWEIGSSHAVETLAAQMDSPGTQYVFSSWSNRKSQRQTFIAPSSGGTYTANFKMQHAVKTSVDDTMAGGVTPGGTSWVLHGQKISIAAKPNEGHQFLNWAGDISGGINPVTLSVTGPMNLVATFSSKGSGTERDSMDTPVTSTPLIGELESPTEGKRVIGVKTIYGWALDGEGISKVKAFIDGQYLCDIPYGGLTEGLKELYPAYPNAEKAGFALVWNYSSLPPGPHQVQIDIENVRGRVLRLNANVVVLKSSGEVITGISPRQWVVSAANVIADGVTKTYDLKLEWSDESQSFEITELYPQ